MLKLVNSLAFDNKLFYDKVSRLFYSFPVHFLGLIEIGHFSQKKIFDNQCELFIAYNLSVRKMKEVLLKNFLSIAKESTTFSMNTGPDFGGSVGFATRTAVSGPLWKSL